MASLDVQTAAWAAGTHRSNSGQGITATAAEHYGKRRSSGPPSPNRRPRSRWREELSVVR